MFFLSVTCQHSALSQLTEEPEAAQVKLAWGDKCHCASGTWQGLGGKEREDVLPKPSKSVGWFSPSRPSTPKDRTALQKERKIAT